MRNKFFLIGLEPRGFRCPISQCEDPNNTTYSAIDEDWLFPTDSNNEDYEYCEPYILSNSTINFENCTDNDFTKLTEEFNINHCSSGQIPHSIIFDMILFMQLQ